MGTHPIFESDFDCLTEIMEKLSDSELRQKCKDAGIKVGPLTGRTRKIYIKKLENLATVQKTGQKSDETNDRNYEQLGQAEIEKLNSAELFKLLDQLGLKKIPVTNSNRKLLAKWIFYKIQGIEEMEWEDFSQQTDFSESDE